MSAEQPPQRVFPIPYQVDFISETKGRHVDATKRKLSWKFGFAHPAAVFPHLHDADGTYTGGGGVPNDSDIAKKGIECRGREHEIIVTWSILTSKVHICERGIFESFKINPSLTPRPRRCSPASLLPLPRPRSPLCSRPRLRLGSAHRCLGRASANDRRGFQGDLPPRPLSQRVHPVHFQWGDHIHLLYQFLKQHSLQINSIQFQLYVTPHAGDAPRIRPSKRRVQRKASHRYPTLRPHADRG